MPLSSAEFTAFNECDRRSQNVLIVTSGGVTMCTVDAPLHSSGFGLGVLAEVESVCVFIFSNSVIMVAMCVSRAECKPAMLVSSLSTRLSNLS